jgi:FKBP-type peptidyl-prolyl cis-trans isomerase
VNNGEKVHRGDLVEFVYEARMVSQTGPVYDSSAQRGTGQPYQYVVGSGDLIPGVDLGLYDMRPGEVRVLESTYDNRIETDIAVHEAHIVAHHLLVLPVPSLLAYGSRGSKLFQIPPSTTLFWTVQMIRVNFVGEAT